MKTLLFSKKTYSLLRIFLGLIFIGSGTIKILDLESFSNVIEAFAILPPELCYPFAVIVSFSEIIFGLGLVMDLKGSLTAIFLMLLVFAAVISYAILMGYDIDCGCFGPQDPEAKAFAGLKLSLARDLCMIAGGIYLYLWRFKNNHHPFLPKILIKNKELK